MNEGQILENDDFGREIASILKSDKSISNIVEVGTFSGLGSTLVIANNMAEHATLYTYENKRDFFNVSKTRYENNQRVKVIYGRLSDMIMEKQDVISNPMFYTVVDHFNIWYDDDLIEFNISPNVSNTLPNTVDFLLLDGGEFSTIGDWHAIKHKNPKYIALDDCNVLKTYAINMELMFNSKYQLHSKGNWRNGWVIYKLKNDLKDSINNILIPVTLGEALDRLTILDIKLQNIVDENKVQIIKNNRDRLIYCMSKYNDYDYDYRILKEINTQLYYLEEKVSYGLENIQEYEIVNTWNTMRDNVKKYIDTKSGCDIVEQKRYKKKVGFFLGHMGYGDVFILNGAIRFSMMKVDEMYLVCNIFKMNNILLMFKDLPNLKLVNEQNFNSIYQQQLEQENIDILLFKSGLYKHQKLDAKYNTITDFYKDLNIPHRIMYDFFHLPSENPTLKPPQVDYIFVHTKSSTHDNKDIISWNINDILTIDSNSNLYKPSDPFFNIAENFLNKPLVCYIDILKNAKEIHVVDSCFSCFVFCMKLKNVSYYDKEKVFTSRYFLPN
jgi:hypothetical protein